MKNLLHYNIGIVLVLALAFCGTLAGQEKNFIDQPYLETNARVDTLVVPDRIYLGIEIKEQDTKGRTSVEELENHMAARLKALGINLDEQLMLSDLASNFRDYFLRKTDVQKSKAYSLLVYDALTAGKVIQELEGIGISNISLLKTEYAPLEELKTKLRQRAISKARKQAVAMLQPLGQNLGRALYISDLNTDYSGIQGRASGIVVRGYAMEKEQQPLDVAFEKITVEGMVNVKFAIE
jgi:hypothetical protein